MGKQQSWRIIPDMQSRQLFPALLVLALSVWSTATYAQNACSKLTEAEVAAAVGQPLKRSTTNPCQFGRALQSFTIIVHSGDGPRFSQYAASARQEFPNVQSVPGVGSEAIFFGFNLAVHASNDVIVIQMLMGKAVPEKITLAKAVAQKLMAHF